MRKRRASQLESLSSEPVLDPLEIVRRAANPPTVDRKARQLCRQVERVVGLVISGELDDDLLRNLMVISVDPAPYTTHLLVTLTTDGPVTEEQLIAMNQRAFQVSGRIRTAVAEAVQRRKAPQLTLRIISPSITA